MELCDLNLIEIVWNELKCSVSKPCHQRTVFYFWEGLTKDKCSKYHVYKVALVVV